MRVSPVLAGTRDTRTFHIHTARRTQQLQEHIQMHNSFAAAHRWHQSARLGSLWPKFLKSRKTVKHSPVGLNRHLVIEFISKKVLSGFICHATPF